MLNVSITRKRRKRIIPTEFDYGLFAPCNRLSYDQVPLQNLGVKTTVDLKGTTQLHIKETRTSFDRRFCTFQLTICAVNPQKCPLVIVFKGKPTKEDPRIPKSPKLKKEIEHFDPRGIYLWDRVAYIRNSNAKIWFEDLNTHFALHDKKLIQSDGYKVFQTVRWKNRFKRSNWKYIISPGGCTDASTSPVDENVGQTFKKKFLAKLATGKLLIFLLVFEN